MTALTTVAPVTAEDIDQLKKQNAMLMRALMRVKAERDALLKQLAERQTEASR